LDSTASLPNRVRSTVDRFNASRQRALTRTAEPQGTDECIARQAWLYVSIVTGAYLLSGGGPEKAASSEP